MRHVDPTPDVRHVDPTPDVCHADPTPDVSAKLARFETKSEREKDAYILGLENDNAQLTQTVNDLQEELKQVREVNAILLDAAVLWHSKLAVNEKEELTLMTKGAFTSNTRKCVYDLLGCHVAQGKNPKCYQISFAIGREKVCSSS